MPYKVLIFGAGSVGNHHCFACRSKGWQVDIFDHDLEALERMRTNIYPNRYGSWDPEIKLLNSLIRSKHYDLIIIGTPPDTHSILIEEALSAFHPKILMVEKPLCSPTLDDISRLTELIQNTDTQCLVGYNHNLTEVTQRTIEILTSGSLGDPLSLHIRWQEHWSGIFSAHPWLKNPGDSYLGWWERGGGACSEHSHAISLWQHMADILHVGRIDQVTAVMDICKSEAYEYDRTTQLLLSTNFGFKGSILLDVVTKPYQKTMRLQCKQGFLEWHTNFDEQNDAIKVGYENTPVETILFPKTRVNDFSPQIQYIDDILSSRRSLTINSVTSGLDTMRIIYAAQLSNKNQETVNI